ncbi:hypothetical protein [Actinomadura sp. SCN-SB]|uniref:hypothetical protein n=1 Tax=Actinomadura sp. SCN-SB TaxID=3373092 RepID=UPI0037502AEA
MRLRTVLAATAVATSALLGTAGPALAGNDPDDDTVAETNLICNLMTSATGSACATPETTD